MIYPGEPGHDMLEGFKVACDTRRSWADKPVDMRPTLLYKALGLLEPRHGPWIDELEYREWPTPN